MNDLYSTVWNKHLRNEHKVKQRFAGRAEVVSLADGGTVDLSSQRAFERTEKRTCFSEKGEDNKLI